MRDALRTALKTAIPELTEVYDPYVPTPKTPKPYAVIVRGSDNKNDKNSFGRNAEIWIYYDIGQLDELDRAVEKVIQGLHYKTIVNPNTGESFTAEVKGTIGTDEQDEDWQAIFRGISLSFVTLYHQMDVEPWEIALKNFLSEKLNIKAYAGQWTTDFQIPSVLCRTVQESVDSPSFDMYRTRKTIRVHAVSSENLKRLMSTIEDMIIVAFKIPLDKTKRSFMLVEKVSEDVDADPLGTGQITVELSNVRLIKHEYKKYKIINTGGRLHE